MTRSAEPRSCACPLLREDVHLLVRMYQLQPLPDFQLLLGRVVRQTPDVFALALVLLDQHLVALLQSLDLLPLLPQAAHSGRAAQRENRVTGHYQECENVNVAARREFHSREPWKIIVSSLSRSSLGIFHDRQNSCAEHMR